MKTVRMAFLILPVAMAMFAQDVRYNFAADENFAKFKTYKWVQVKGTDQLNQLADEQLKSAVDAELTKKGLMRTTEDNADLFVAYQVALSEEKQFTSYDTGWGYGPGWHGGWYGGGGGISTTTSSTIPVGQLALDMYASNDKKLVWRGMASKTLDPKAKPEKRQKNLQKGIAKLLKNYPPKQKS
jgi:hypothetical protein